MKDKTKIKVPEKVTVKMSIDQQSPDFGEREKGEEFSMNSDLAKLLEGRGILKIVKKEKNVNE
jgi:hypothetical protein